MTTRNFQTPLGTASTLSDPPAKSWRLRAGPEAADICHHPSHHRGQFSQGLCTHWIYRRTIYKPLNPTSPTVFGILQISP
ncbi:hypothetical protein DV515_00000214 [Chloebia gouldiae]|uniref:Uncharacterized protein n=1 Tax=Chloebia gouldiae TaxID=44316 RepID=A0A3L8T0R0_CHLGU|nr:hypothetical protein DV515_00000214 [Chloebia gouldiae]